MNDVEKEIEGLKKDVRDLKSYIRTLQIDALNQRDTLATVLEQIDFLREITREYRYQNDYGLNEREAWGIRQVLENVGITQKKFKRWDRSSLIMSTEKDQQEYDEIDVETRIRGQRNPYVAVESD